MKKKRTRKKVTVRRQPVRDIWGDDPASEEAVIPRRASKKSTSTNKPVAKKKKRTTKKKVFQIETQEVDATPLPKKKKVIVDAQRMYPPGTKAPIDAANEAGIQVDEASGEPGEMFVRMLSTDLRIVPVIAPLVVERMLSGFTLIDNEPSIPRAMGNPYKCDDENVQNNPRPRARKSGEDVSTIVGAYSYWSKCMYADLTKWPNHPYLTYKYVHVVGNRVQALLGGESTFGERVG